MSITSKINNVSIQELRRKGFPIIQGSKYIPKSWIYRKNIPLKGIHRRLAKIKGSLAEEIAQMRDEF